MDQIIKQSDSKKNEIAMHAAILNEASSTDQDYSANKTPINASKSSSEEK
jgi:hypothetical protein